MGTKGTAAKKAASARTPQDRRVSQITSAAQWRAKSRDNAEELEVPSGNVALIRRVGPEAFLSGGRIPDALTPIVEEAIREAEGRPPVAKMAMLDNEEMLPQIMQVMNLIVCESVMEPRVTQVPDCTASISDDQDGSARECGAQPGDKVHHERDNEHYHKFQDPRLDPEWDDGGDVLYVDEVDLTDKMFIMNFAVGGTRDLETFREEQGSLVATLQSLQGGEGSPE